MSTEQLEITCLASLEKAFDEMRLAFGGEAIILFPELADAVLQFFRRPIVIIRFHLQCCINVIRPGAESFFDGYSVTRIEIGNARRFIILFIKLARAIEKIFGRVF